MGRPNTYYRKRRNNKMSNFKFEHNGEEIEFEKGFEELGTPRWLRANRKLDGMDMAFTIVEDFGGEAVCAAVDEMSTKEFADFSEKMMAAVGKAIESSVK
jgi:hypothetical protein